MALEPDEPRRKAADTVGEPLDLMSVDELDARIARLEAEIARTQGARAAKLASRNAADAFFKT